MRPPERAIVLVGLSAGLAEADIMNLKVKDFTAAYDVTTGIATMKLTRVKTGIKYCTFLTPEASQSVLDYLEFRNRPIPHGIPKQRVDQLKKQHVESGNGYLFILRSIPDGYLETRDEELRKFKVRAFTKLYEHLAEKCGKKNPEGCNIVRPHNMRKYFISTLRNTGFELAVINHMAGHKEKAVDRAYYWADAEKLKEQYKKFVPYITIQKELNVSESSDYLKIKQENQILQAETTRHVVERSKLQELRQKLDRMERENEEKSEIMDIFLNTIDTYMLKNL
jgi:integrase